MTQKSVDQTSEGDVEVRRNGAAAIVSLNRTRALNALTVAMRDEIARAIPGFARDHNLYIVVFRSTNPKAFSAGGDVRELIGMYRDEPSKAYTAFADEYRLNWTLDCFSKPTVSLIDGMVMGSGVGISLYNTHRVAGAGYKFAMPETAIGLFPDVGVAHVLARLPDEIGTYLGLTGRTIARADAYRLGLVTHCIEATRFDDIEAALADARPVDVLLDDLHQDPGPGDLEGVTPMIARCFKGSSVEEIIAALKSVSGPDSGFADGVLADLAKRSPTSLKITLRHLRQAAGMDLREVLIVDQRLACRCLAGHDFAEGVRAALIDKDNQPVWQPATLDDVGAAAVDAYFAPLSDGQELTLASRAEMQASRI